MFKHVDSFCHWMMVRCNIYQQCMILVNTLIIHTKTGARTVLLEYFCQEVNFLLEYFVTGACCINQRLHSSKQIHLSDHFCDSGVLIMEVLLHQDNTVLCYMLYCSMLRKNVYHLNNCIVFLCRCSYLSNLDQLQSAGPESRDFALVTIVYTSGTKLYT